MLGKGRSAVFLIVLLVGSISGLAQGGCEPRVDMGALLNNVHVSGSLYIGSLYARCLPKPVKVSSSNFEYNPYDGGKLSTVLKSSSGQVLNTFVWYGHNVQSLWELSRYEVVGGAAAVKKLMPGSYSLEFAVEDKVFQKFPFAVTTRESSDQFKPETLYILDGGWSDYAELYSPNLDRFIQLFVWLRNDDGLSDPKPRAVPFHIRLIRESDKKTLAEDSTGKLNLTHKWQQYKLSFRKPGAAETKDYSEFKLSEILAVEGKYRIELALDGKPRSSYSFTVKDGKLNGLDLAAMRKENYRVSVPLSANGKE
jgi:hypothetical protein